MKQRLLVPYTFVLMNWAAVVSLYRFLRRGKEMARGVQTPLPAQSQAASRVPETIADRQSRAA